MVYSWYFQVRNAAEWMDLSSFHGQGNQNEPNKHNVGVETLTEDCFM